MPHNVHSFGHTKGGNLLLATTNSFRKESKLSFLHRLRLPNAYACVQRSLMDVVKYRAFLFEYSLLKKAAVAAYKLLRI